MHLFISAGEPSGDLHGANLIEALKRIDPMIRFTSASTPPLRIMAAYSCNVRFPKSERQLHASILSICGTWSTSALRE